MFLPDYQPVSRTDLREPFERLWHQASDPVRGLTVVEIIHAIHAGEIKRHVLSRARTPRCRPEVQQPASFGQTRSSGGAGLFS